MTLQEEKLKAEANLKEEKLKIAKEMLNNNIDINLTSQITKLLLDEIIKLTNKT